MSSDHADAIAAAQATLDPFLPPFHPGDFTSREQHFTFAAGWLAPNSESVTSSGLGRELDAVRTTAQLAVDHGYQLCLHAIGDRANREALNIYEQAFRNNNRSGKDLRWRVEHAQHIPPYAIPRL